MSLFDLNKKTPRRLDIVLCAVLALLTAISFGGIVRHDFVGYDDDKYITENLQVQQGLSREGIGWAFASLRASNWHPLTWLSHMLDVELYGMNAGGHHCTSLLLHLANSLLLFVVLRTMTASVWQSAAVAALFAVHPLHVESVAWAAERKDVLSTFFGLLALRSYVLRISDPRSHYSPATVLWFLLSLMAKPMLVTLPFLLLLLDYWPLQRIYGRDGGQTLRLRRLLQEKIPLFLLSAASCLITFFAQQQGNAVGGADEYPLRLRAANVLLSYLKYIGKMIWPSDLAVLYPYPETISAWQMFSAAAALGSMTLLAAWNWKRFPWLFVGWFWYAGTLVPVIGIVQVGVQAYADRYTYVPLIGLFIILSWGAEALLPNRRWKKPALAVLAATVLSVLTIASRMQAAYWKDSFTLFEHTLQVTESNYIIRNNLGFELTLQGQHEKAAEQYKEAFRINPEFEQAYVNYGSALSASGKIEESVAHYQSVLRDRPHFAGVHYNFGVLLLQTCCLDEAAFHFQQALRIRPTFAAACNGLGAVLMAKGKTEAAAVFFRKALEIDPGLAEARTNLENASGQSSDSI